MKIIVIVGLPASGKTHYIEEIRQLGDVILDDFITPAKIKAALSFKPYRLILSDPYFCRPTVLTKLLELIRGYDVEFVFYENNPDQCIINAATRQEKNVDGFIRLLSETYNPPRIDKKVYKV